MKKFIFGEKSGIYIINLELTLECLLQAVDFLKRVSAEGKEILFIGTKKQARDVIRETAQRSGMPYVHERWLGGMLTNFATVRKSVARLDWIDQMEKEGNFRFITKKEVSQLHKEREKLVRYLSGVRQMKKLPGALFIIDTNKEEIALHEARVLGLPVVALIDTNCDPDLVDYPIPGNDDAIRAIKLFCDLVADVVIEGRNEFLKIYPSVEEAKEPVSVTEEAAPPPEAPEAALAPTAVPPSGEEPPPVLAADPKIVDEVLDEKLHQEKMKEEVRLKAKRPVRTKDTKKTKP